MAPAAAHLSRGAPIDQAGPSISRESCVIIAASVPRCSDSEIIGEIVSIDRFGNLITNIETIHFDRLVRKGGLTIRIKSSEVGFHHTSYAKLPDRRPAALLNSSNLLEICIKNGSAADFFEVQIGERVLVTGS